MRETNTRLASENAEERIAAGDTPTTATAFDISLAGFTIPSKADTYTEAVGEGDTIAGTEEGRIDVSGGRSYTVLKGYEPPPPLPLLHGYFPETSPPTLFTGLTAVMAYDNVYEYKILVTGTYRLEAWGAAGGPIDSLSPVTINGMGGYAAGEARLAKGTTLYIYAGGKGATITGVSLTANGGFNGGGNGRNSTSVDNSGSHYRTGGGGASDIRIIKDDLHSRIIVAGGGGGNAEGPINGNPGRYAAGDGGGSQGGDGVDKHPSYNNIGYGGTQVAGGQSATSSSNISGNFAPSAFGLGASHTGSSGMGAGGGGGWYGGGAGFPAGGGSGWVYTESALNVWRTDNPTDAAGWKLDATYCLDKPVLIHGNAPMPNPLDTGYDPATFDPELAATWNNTMPEGNAGGGFVRVTFLR
jgi:hypothetical protein